MALPSAVEDHIAMLRNEVRRASFVTARILRNNARAHAQNALVLVERTPEIDRAAERAVAACDTLSERLSPPPSEAARADALSAIDELARTLECARPSDRARCLGMGW